MDKTILPIGINEHSIGVVFKEAVRRAIVVIRHQMLVFDTLAKKGHSGEMDDIVTSADAAAQDVYVKIFSECFPGLGIIAEEDHLRIPCTLNGIDAYITVDSLDGSRAFARRQSHGTSTMIAMVLDGEIIAVCIGDINTQEMYCYRPLSPNVHRITEYENSEKLSYRLELLVGSYVILREDPRTYSPIIHEVLLGESPRGIFGGIEVTGGSIGMSMSRLWKGECSVAILAPFTETPWDSTPVIGITKKLGYGFYTIDSVNGTLEEYTYNPSKEVFHRDREIIVVHKTAVDQLQDHIHSQL